MQRHYCREEKCWLDFEEVCSWCGITEEGARQLHGMIDNGEHNAPIRTDMGTLALAVQNPSRARDDTTLDGTEGFK